MPHRCRLGLLLSSVRNCEVNTVAALTVACLAVTLVVDDVPGMWSCGSSDSSWARTVVLTSVLTLRAPATRFQLGVMTVTCQRLNRIHKTSGGKSVPRLQFLAPETGVCFFLNAKARRFPHRISSANCAVLGVYYALNPKYLQLPYRMDR